MQAVTSIKLSNQINVTTQQNGFDSESSEGSGSAQVEEVCEKGEIMCFGFLIGFYNYSSAK